MKLAIAYDDAFLDHVERGHPERPERLLALRQAITEVGYWDESNMITPREASLEELYRVHSESYINQTLSRLEKGHGHLDPDTFFSPGSRDAALLAAGGGVDVARAVWTQEADLGLALVRPPGHHAERSRAGGFCIFNNIAVAAAALREEGAERVLIYDWDVHHGNGTQHQFEDQKDIFYVSVHAWPHYPGSGLSNEIGVGEGEGYTANVPYPHGADDVAYAQVVDRLLSPIIRAFEPSIILISAGFDAHRNDMLGGMGMTEAGYRYEAKVIRDLAGELCDGKVALFLEGGYDLGAIASSMAAVLQVFDGADPSRPEGALSQRHEAVLDETLENLGRVWPDLK